MYDPIGYLNSSIGFLHACESFKFYNKEDRISASDRECIP